MTSQEEKKNRRIAMISSLGIHAVVLVLLIFMVAWKQPNPPHPEIGIEVNWGEDTRGSGNTAPDKSAGSEGTQQEEPEQPTPVEETPEPQPKPVVEETQPVQQEVVAQTESPVVVEKKEEKKVEPPVEKVVPRKEPEPEKPKVNPDAVYKPKTQTQSDNKTSEAKAGQQANEGNDANAAGNKGQVDGTLNPNAVYKGPSGGGGNGLGLSMPGWEWVSQPRPKGLTSTLSGKVRFEIEVDANGEITRINTLERTLNFEDERMLKNLIMQSRLEKTSPGDAPPRSKGIVEFNLRLE